MGIAKPSVFPSTTFLYKGKRPSSNLGSISSGSLFGTTSPELLTTNDTIDSLKISSTFSTVQGASIEGEKPSELKIFFLISA